MKSEQSITEGVSLCILKTWLSNRYVVQSQTSYPNPEAIRNVSSAQRKLSLEGNCCEKKLQTEKRDPLLEPQHSFRPSLHLTSDMARTSWPPCLDNFYSASDFSEPHHLPALIQREVYLFMKCASEDCTICTIISEQWHPPALDQRCMRKKSWTGKPHSSRLRRSNKSCVAAVQLWSSKMWSKI